MAKVRIVSDSTCDLSPELKEKYDIKVIPLCIVMDDKSYFDMEEITPLEIFDWADANKTTPKTAAASIENAIQLAKNGLSAEDIASKLVETSLLYRVSGIKSHMMKNTEWGAVAYLTNAVGRIPYINNSSSYITGNAGNSVGRVLI